jgi:hypothetical protein
MRSRDVLTAAGAPHQATRTADKTIMLLPHDNQDENFSPRLSFYMRRQIRPLWNHSDTKIDGQLCPSVYRQLQHVGPAIVADRVKVVQSLRRDPVRSKNRNDSRKRGLSGRGVALRVVLRYFRGDWGVARCDGAKGDLWSEHAFWPTSPEAWTGSCFCATSILPPKIES